MAEMPETFLDRSMPEPNSGCWLWVGGVTSDGYAGFYHDGKCHRAHRFSYEFHNGPVPTGLVLDHLCRVKTCVNPDHLEPVTNRENLVRGISHNGQKTHCKHGHEYSQENTYVNPSGSRNCRVCMRISDRKRKAKV